MKQKFFKGPQLIIYTAVALMVGFYSIFFFYPLVISIIGSFMDWNPLNGTFNFAGLENYTRMMGDPVFKEAFFNTLYFTTVVVILRASLAFGIALLLYNVYKFSSIFRSSFFLPVIMPIVSVAIIWEWMYDPRIGLINTALAAFGIVGKNWLADTSTAMNSVILMTVWKDVGYAVIIFLAGLLNMPTSVLEAAKIDGASYFRTVTQIIVPMMKPTVIFILITSLISYFQAFTQIFIMTEGGPGTSTYVISYMIYNEAFKNFNFGYGSALSTVLFIIIIIVTFVQLKVMKGLDD